MLIGVHLILHPRCQVDGILRLKRGEMCVFVGKFDGGERKKPEGWSSSRLELLIWYFSWMSQSSLPAGAQSAGAPYPYSRTGRQGAWLRDNNCPSPVTFLLAHCYYLWSDFRNSPVLESLYSFLHLRSILVISGLVPTDFVCNYCSRRFSAPSRRVFGLLESVLWSFCRLDHRSSRLCAHPLDR